MTADEFTLPEMRERQRVAFGGISRTHVVVESTFPASVHGGWTRRSWDRRTLCGAMRACVVGGDAEEWPTEREPIDISRVDCARCRERYERWLSKRVVA